MRTIAKRKQSDWRSYPTTPNIRSGCKVGWNYYDRLIDAQQCAEAAKHNAVIQLGRGYDFGYCAPGSIRKITDADDIAGKDNIGKYEVCIP